MNRLPDLVHYIVWSCDPSELGATKLNKICWFADLEAYRQFGRTITGADRYHRLQHGPAPKGVHHVLDALEREAKIARGTQDYFGRQKQVFIARTKPNLSPFSGEEIALVDGIARLICSRHTATSISEVSHDALWQEVPLGGDIPIVAAAVFPGEVTPEDMDWAVSFLDGLDENSAPADRI